MTYNNPLLAFADRNPMIGFFGLPVAIYYGSVLVSAMIRKGKTGEYLAGNPFGREDREGALSGLGALTEGGSPDDMMFRATASTAPTKRGTTTTVYSCPTLTISIITILLYINHTIVRSQIHMYLQE